MSNNPDIIDKYNNEDTEINRFIEEFIAKKEKDNVEE